ncbi:MAG TPA: NAD(P)-binding oxidoreductase [Euzebyales bacterium]
MHHLHEPRRSPPSRTQPPQTAAAPGLASRAGHRAHAASTGAGIDDAVEGAEIVVHLAGSGTGDEDKARNLVRAASQVGVRHLVYISVVGVDKVPVVSRVDRAMFGYFASKRAAERIVADSGLPWTTLRATQFHDLTLTTVRAMAKLPVVPVPSGWRFQPIDTSEVAARLAVLALAEPAGLVPTWAGHACTRRPSWSAAICGQAR